MKLKNVKVGTKCILKESFEPLFGFNVGDEVLIHVTTPLRSGQIGIVKCGGDGHSFGGFGKRIPPIPDGYTGLWVKPEELKRVKESK